MRLQHLTCLAAAAHWSPPALAGAAASAAATAAAAPGAGRRGDLSALCSAWLRYEGLLRSRRLGVLRKAGASSAAGAQSGGKRHRGEQGGGGWHMAVGLAQAVAVVQLQPKVHSECRRRQELPRTPLQRLPEAGRDAPSASLPRLAPELSCTGLSASAGACWGRGAAA